MSSLEGKATRQLLCLTAGLLILVAFVVAPRHALAYSDDYPSKWQGPMDSTLDDWGYYNRECTSFVAWRLHARNGFEMPRAIGNAAGWGTWAKNSGYRVDMEAKTGAVAWFANHVAWVESVGGSSITVEEYNHNFDGTYSERTVPASSVNGYIHFKDTDTSAPQGGDRIGSFLGTDHLVANQVMHAGEYILSQNVQYVLVMQGDGNLVLYGSGMRALWASGTSGSGAVYAVMQGDGNLVLYRANWTAVWSSHTAGRGSSYLYIQDDGNTVVYTYSWAATWASNTGGRPVYNYRGSPVLGANQIMYQNQYLRSPDKRIAILFQSDGNLVLYGPGYHVLWSAGVGSRGATYTVMQGDGNLVIYRSDWAPLWSTGTYGRGSSVAQVQNDGNFVVYNSVWVSTWASNTAGQM